MKPLQGLYILIASKAALRKRRRDDARNRDAEPSVSHTAAFEVEQLTREIAVTHNAIQESEKIVTDIDHLITALRHSSFKSDHRKQAILCLDDAAMRLRRELGDKPTDSVSAE